MKLLIVYATKTGATQTCAELLAKEFSGCTICSLAKEMPDINKFDTVIIGSGIRMGKIYKPVKKFINCNMSALQSKNIAIFLCNAYPDTTQKAIEKNFSVKFGDATICIESFGGKTPFSSDTGSLAWVNKNNINSFVQFINNMT